jgi:hypothetical protein
MRRQPGRRRPQAAAPRCQLFSFCWTWCVCLAFVELDTNCIRSMNSMYNVIRYINSVLYICYELLICSLEFWLTKCRICFKLETECRFLSSGDEWADVSLSIAAVTPSSDRWMTSAHSSLLGATVVIGILCSSLLCCHYSDGPVAHGHSDLRPAL